MVLVRQRQLWRRGVATFIVAFALLALDLRQPPAEQWTARMTIASIHLYQATLSQWYTRIGVRCRFTLSCSRYGEECIRRFGAARGGWMAMRRVLRCGPWTPAGTVDPPPVAQAAGKYNARPSSVSSTHSA
jgi:putative membrane protein insertion efficiency factor